MTLNEIIVLLYNSKEIDDCIRKMVRQDHQKDFKQELFLKIYEIPEQRLIMLYESNGLKFYIVRSLINLVKNNSSVYNKNYVRPERLNIGVLTQDGFYDHMESVSSNKKEAHFADHYDPEEMDQRIASEEKESRLVSEIDNGLDNAFGTHYYRSLVHLISKHGSMREVSRQTGIPIASISEAVKKTRNYLKAKVFNDPEIIKGIY